MLGQAERMLLQGTLLDAPSAAKVGLLGSRIASSQANVR